VRRLFFLLLLFVYSNLMMCQISRSYALNFSGRSTT